MTVECLHLHPTFLMPWLSEPGFESRPRLPFSSMQWVQLSTVNSKPMTQQRQIGSHGNNKLQPPIQDLKVILPTKENTKAKKRSPTEEEKVWNRDLDSVTTQFTYFLPRYTLSTASSKPTTSVQKSERYGFMS